MSTNISKEKREQLVAKIGAIKDYIAAARQDENTAQLLAYIADIEKDIKSKKYGLVFEEHREKVDKILEENTPVLTEDKSLFIDNGGQMNFLIEGDNLAALQLLEKTHKGKIDLIYIDPPYNTGNTTVKDFIYDDNFVDANDTFRHSKWLSFVEKRLLIAKGLLSDNGIIYISIDDHEQCALKLLCDEIFNEKCYLSTLIWNKNSTTVMLNKEGFSSNTEYVLLYKKQNVLTLKNNPVSKKLAKSYNKDDNDGRGKYGTVHLYTNTNTNKRVALKMPDGSLFEAKWQVTQETFDEYVKQGIIIKTPSGWRKKIYLSNCKGSVPVTMLDSNIVGTTKTGTGEIQAIFENTAFPYPKPTTLLSYLIDRYPKDDITILDFFAGSGTTGHAVMKLNAEDGGTRKFILCTNNENNICRDVTYERIKRVIERDRYGASLKYYKVDYVPISNKMYYEYADELLKHIRELVELENGINFNGNAEIAIILKEQELDEFALNIPSECRAIYLGHDVLPNKKQETLFKEHGIAVHIIPDYYYRELEG